MPKPAKAARRLAVAIAAAVTLAAPAGATAARPLEIGFSDSLYGSHERDLWLDRTAAVGADIIRVNMYWAVVGFNKPSDPRDPADPAYDWSEYDRQIVSAAEHGFAIELTVTNAPHWAEGPGRPPSFERAPPGSWRPDARAYGDFIHAVAERYSGSYVVAGGPYSEPVTLPRINYLEAWNEPNLGTYINPQYRGRKNVSASIYVRMLNAAYDEVKAVDPRMQVVTGGTAPYGDPPSSRATKTGPLAFYRELLCLSRRLKRTRCAAGQRAKFDVLAHHPINRADPPTAHAERADDIEIADFGKLREALRAAERLGTTGTPGRHALWANEIWWQTNPPDTSEGVSYATHARWTQQALYLLWRQGAANVTFLQIRDTKHKPHEYTLDTYQTGIYTYGGKRKPTATAVAFPFVTDRRGGRRLLAWGRPPKSGRLTIEIKRGGGGFRRLTTARVQAGRVFTKMLHVRGDAKLRARVGGRRSLIWDQRGGRR
ncbi:MAG: hypothetical protein U0R24_07215 [Solirubrobacterales bacterium]